MAGPIHERDWKYLRSIQDEMLNELCSRILTEVAEIAGAGGTPHQRYRALYRHLQKSDDIIADCFDDWRRSTINVRILNLRHHRLLKDEHVTRMSGEAQEWLRRMEAELDL